MPLSDGSSSVSVREAQSIAFFNTPVIELLYSGRSNQQPLAFHEQRLEFPRIFRHAFRRLQVLIKKGASETPRKSANVTSAHCLPHADRGILNEKLIVGSALRVLPAKARSLTWLIRSSQRNRRRNARSGVPLSIDSPKCRKSAHHPRLPRAGVLMMDAAPPSLRLIAIGIAHETDPELMVRHFCRKLWRSPALCAAGHDRRESRLDRRSSEVQNRVLADFAEALRSRQHDPHRLISRKARFGPASKSDFKPSTPW